MVQWYYTTIPFFWSWWRKVVLLHDGEMCIERAGKLGRWIFFLMKFWYCNLVDTYQMANLGMGMGNRSVVYCSGFATLISMVGKFPFHGLYIVGGPFFFGQLMTMQSSSPVPL